MHSFLALTLLHILPSLVAAVPPPTGWTSIKPFSDSKCSQPLKMTEDEGQDIAELKFGTHIDDQDGGSGEYYDNITFTDADPANNGAVYWSFPESKESCVFILMREEQEGWQYATDLPGRILVVAKEPGCYYTSLEANQDLITSVCCGDDACQPVDMGSGQVITGNFPAPPASPQKLDCKVTSIKETGMKTMGPQQAVSAKQTCPSTEGCKFGVSDTWEFSRAVSVTNTESYETTVGVDVSVEAGMDFIVDTTVSTSFSTSFSEAWGTETGEENTTTTAHSVTQELTHPIGTTAILTFTPIYYCDTVDYECTVDGNQDAVVNPEATVCNPYVSGAGIIGGDYGIVFMS